MNNLHGIERSGEPQVTNRRDFLKQAGVAAASLLLAGGAVAVASQKPMPAWFDEFKPWAARAYDAGLEYRAQLPIHGKATVEQLGNIMHDLSDLEVIYRKVSRAYYDPTKTGGLAIFPAEWMEPEREAEMLVFVIVCHLFHRAPGLHLYFPTTEAEQATFDQRQRESTLKTKMLERCFLEGLNGE